MKLITKIFTIGYIWSLSLPLSAQIEATANFNRWIEHPLVKKIGVYQTPLTCQRWLERDLPKMSEIEARSMRYEIAWGKKVFGYPSISGTKEQPVYDFKGVDLFCDRVNEQTPTLILSQGYCPDIIKPCREGNCWQQPPNDYPVWAAINKRFSQHWKEKGYSNHYIEVWNEPDLTNIFFLGTKEDYLKIYEYAAPAIREGDADVKIGGPSGAGSAWHNDLVKLAQEKNLPLDFLSGHAYGAINWQLDAMRNALNLSNNKQAEMIMTEYSPYQGKEMGAEGKVERAEAAMTFFNAVPTFLEYVDLTHLTWAQYIDPGDPYQETTFAQGGGDKMGLIDGDYGYRKSLFNAFKLYGWMPIDRYYFKVGAPLKGMASADKERIAAVIWNPENITYPIHLNLKNIPFTEGTLEIYHIDSTTNSWFETGRDDLIPSRTENVRMVNQTIDITDEVKGQGVFFVRIAANDAKPHLPENRFAKIIRTHQWYDSRSNTAPYALFDAKTWTARLSMNEHINGRAIVGIAAENLPEEMQVTSVTSEDLLDKGDNSTLNLRVDYQSTSGEYTKSVLYHGGLYHSQRTNGIQWGTRKSPDEIIEVDDFNNFMVDLKKHQPADFSGRAIITFDMDCVGENSKANIQVKRTDNVGLSSVKITDISKHEATLSAMVSGNELETIAEAGFCWAIDQDPRDSADKKAVSIKSTSIHCTLSDLKPDRHYHVRAYLKTKNGNLIYTPEAVFHSLAEPAVVKTYEPTVDKERLFVWFEGKVSNENDSPVYQTGFVWCTGHDHAPTVGDHKVKIGKGTNRFEYKLEKLKPETDYSVRAFAFNGGGVSYGKTYPFSTKASTGIQEVRSSDVIIYPNPAKHRIHILYHQLPSYKIVDQTGKVILSEETPTENIPVSSLSPGIYFLRLNFNQQIITKKFIKN